MTRHILTIAGSDSSGGAGIQADLKTFAALECYGASVITSITAQNTMGVSAVHDVPLDIIQAQLQAVFEDVRIDAVKIGMVGSAGIATLIVKALQHFKPAHVVLDPVMIAQSGAVLADDETILAIRDKLCPMATVITPNIPEAEVLLGREFGGDMEDFARNLMGLEARSVFLKGGHLIGQDATDIYIDGNSMVTLSEPRIDTDNTHGTGCTLSSAMASYLAKGLPPAEAAHAAKKYVTGTIRYAHALDVGRGPGPLNHFYAQWGRPQE